MSKRTIQVGRQIRNQLVKLIDELRDPRIGELVITEVELSPDLLFAKVYYDSNEEPEEIEATQTGLEHAVPHLRRRLAAELNLRNTPQITFHFDKDLHRAERVRELIDEVSTDDDPASGEA
ncbi:MAG: 30S ribosome-binding factor RbfA [Candidatus Coatesbacteria bacterium]|nr:30S ribosome-binding factor RbfA [Candidatus Coatesbacteria bacterium]